MSAIQESFAYVGLVYEDPDGRTVCLGPYVLSRVPCVGETVSICSTWEVLAVQHEATGGDIEHSCAMLLVRKASRVLPVSPGLRRAGAT